MMCLMQLPVSPDTPPWRLQFQDLRERRPDLAEKVCRKLLVDMQRQGLVDFDSLDDEVTEALHLSGERRGTDPNRPKPKIVPGTRLALYELAIKYAERYLEPDEILAAILLTEKRQLAFDVSRMAEDSETPFVELREKIREFLEFFPGEAIAPQASIIGTRAALVRRLLTDQLPFIAVAKKYIRVRDFNYLLEHLVPTEGNQGRIGGKAAGLLLARSILDHANRQGRFDTEFKIPESYFVPSNGILEFIEHNHLEEVINVKYQEIDEVREEFPLVERLFKSGAFPPILHKGLEEMLWTIGEKPLVIRSSSLLEDRIGHAFSGKYKSLFIANRGPIERRLAELEDAISEVYASIFHPDPIEYRKERGLLDFQEQMGILVQVVVGKEMEGLLMPAFAGVAFSRCEMRWSPRIKRTDGMARLVLGLGTRAVDRTDDDWPVMVALDQPHLQVLQQPEEVYQYSQHEVDFVDLKGGQFESVELETLLKRLGRRIPMANKIFSIYRHRQLVPILGFMMQSDDQLVVTFNGLLNSSFPRELKQILELLEEGLEEPVDVEFAHDGDCLHVLQCRALSLASSANHIPIPPDVPDADKIFSATRFVQMAQIRNLEWVVVIDPRDYEQLPTKEAMLRVAKAVGAINRTLKPKTFILIGPGRWGSRGDIRLGVPVTYADICHTTMLLEVARQKGSYVPDVSFGTHFFQDLVEAKITYLPLYPDGEGAIWNEEFLNNSPNALAEIVPKYADLEEVVKIIDVRKVSDGRYLQVIMDGEAERALAFLGPEHI
ncbi:MAG: pyruvate, phosphate dikinase [Acidobacteria bacterium]|nr:MAG: pyruvate, phosphate dikinase [Acidobacteriota bacterium]